MIRRRPSQARIVSPKLLIVTEGLQTERKYITAVRISKSIPTPRVLVLPHECTDPLSLVQQIIKARDERAYLGSFDMASGDEAWAVFDVDEHRQSEPERFRRAIELANSNGIHLATSNPSIELWLLLHYTPHTANIARRAALDSVKAELPTFDKTLPDKESAALLERLADAITNARSLRARNDGMPAPVDPFRNPSTTFDLLIDRILNLAT